MRIAGAAVLLIGLGLMVGGARSLGSALTPLPRPREAGSLRDGGVYGFVRHPIYGGLMLSTLGVALSGSPWALPPVGVLVLVLVGKSRARGTMADRALPRSTLTYRERIRRRFLPFVW